jgi:hypothetical protein
MSELRDKLRAKVLATRTPTTKIIKFFGENIEIRQPNLAAILEARDSTERESALINILMMYAYVPGTDEKIFEEADKDSLLALPFGGDFVALTEAMQELTNVNFLDREPISGTTESGSSSSESPGS